LLIKTLPTGIVPLGSILYIKRDADEKCQGELTLAREVSKSVPFIRAKQERESENLLYYI